MARPGASLRYIGALAGGVAALAASGAAAQSLATRRDARRFPPPGVLVDVGGCRLHLNIQGGNGQGEEAGATVVLEAGMGSFSSNWYWVQNELAKSMRVVSYDRAGLGWSERGHRPRDAATMARELHTALHAAGVQGPYVLAGHSFGGLPVRAFAGLFAGETAGVVLVDASHPDQWLRWPVQRADRMIATSQRVSAVLARFGVLRLVDLSRRISVGLPERQVAELRARSALPGASAVEAEQMDAWPESRAQLPASLGDLPLVVLGVGDQPRGAATLTELQSELPGLSANSARRVVRGATHEALVARREHALVVADAIRAVVAGEPTRILKPAEGAG
jgi:pimeloyl-ACP methyl ester carboxylesterase